MKAFFLVWGLFQSLGFVCCDGCLQAQDYICKQIPAGYPANLSSLVFLMTNMGEINATLFNDTNLSSVSSLIMTQTGINAIARKAFAQFRSLKILNLHSNDLFQVTSDWFIHKEVLESLILSNNKIESLDENSFAGLVGLLNLNLSYNQIHTIASKSFHSLTERSQLRYLDLSHNYLKHLGVDTLKPLNNTKIHLHGNHWVCSCSVYEFVLYLRELQKASLLQNEMEVLCESPAHLQERPVWNVSKCVNPVTNPVTDVTFTTRSSQTPTPKSTNLSLIIGLVVVLCALVLVICALSVLYHRKQVHKHQVTIQPFPAEQEGPSKAQPDSQAMLQMCNNLDCNTSDEKRNQSNKRLLLKLNQGVLESQIYSTGMYQTRMMPSRPKSAGPVLSRTDYTESQPKTQVENSGQWMDQELCADWTEYQLGKLDGKDTELKEKKIEHVGKDKQQEAERTKINKVCRLVEERNDDITTLKSGVENKQNAEDVEKNKHILEGNVKEQEFLHTEDSVPSNEEYDDEDKLIATLGRSHPPQEHDGFQPVGNVENIPYLTIGADPEKQSLKSKVEQVCAKDSTGQLNLRPFRRTLSWPPTAAQWKKQWAQTQQILGVSPKFFFITQYEYHIGKFPSGISSAIPETVPEASGSSFPEQQLQIFNLEDFRSLEPSVETGESINQSIFQDLSSLTKDYVQINEGHTEMGESFPPINSQAHPDFVNVRPQCEGMSSDTVNKVQSRGSKTKQTPRVQQKKASPERKSRRAERDRQKDQSHFSSGAPPAGGSPSDDKLLVDNEYTFIDLLHEVVENSGRWTRDRWRKSHMNKQKVKQASKF